MQKPPNPIRLLILDDHAMFRESLARTFEREPDFQLVGQCASGAEALALIGQNPVDMVLLDVDLGLERGFEFVEKAAHAGFEGKVLIVTAGISGQEAVQFIESGVAGIVHKHQSIETLCTAIRKVASGDAYMETEYLAPLFRSVDRKNKPARPKLTERDRSLLRLIFQGLTNREIGERLEISEGAVKASIHQLFEKLSVRTRAQVVKVALEQYRDQL
jgi:two-component system nitrate/nitrite response regulator NarL